MLPAVLDFSGFPVGIAVHVHNEPRQLLSKGDHAIQARVLWLQGPNHFQVVKTVDFGGHDECFGLNQWHNLI